MKLIVAIAAITLLVISASAAAGRRPNVSVAVSPSGLFVRVPPGWQVVHRKLTPCSNPVERLTVAGRGALVMLQERLPLYAPGFKPRPSRFALTGKPSEMECCALAHRVGWMLSFRDRGRAFYAYVYLGREGTRREALGVLDSLDVRPRA